MEATLREQNDRIAITNVINRYGTTIDAGDYEGLASCFTPDAHRSVRARPGVPWRRGGGGVRAGGDGGACSAAAPAREPRNRTRRRPGNGRDLPPRDPDRGGGGWGRPHFDRRYLPRRARAHRTAAGSSPSGRCSPSGGSGATSPASLSVKNAPVGVEQRARVGVKGRTAGVRRPMMRRCSTR